MQTHAATTQAANQATNPEVLILLLTSSSTKHLINVSTLACRRFISVLEPLDEDEYVVPSETELLSLEYQESQLEEDE